MLNLDQAYIANSDKLQVSENGRIHNSKHIYLPNQKDRISHIGIDIGGSLAKVTYFLNGKLQFAKLETEKIDEFIKFLKKIIIQIQMEIGILDKTENYEEIYLDNSNFVNRGISIYGTGGGSILFYKKLSKELQLNTFDDHLLIPKPPVLKTKDEMASLIEGLNFLIHNIPNEVFIYNNNNPHSSTQHDRIEDNTHKNLQNIDFNNTEPVYPYLLVNIGSGVSMIKVTGPTDHLRIGGSSLGGGTLWGLLSLLTNAESYDDMLTIASLGDNSAVDMLVGDIYGEAYNKIGLKLTTIASSFGKVFKTVTGKKVSVDNESVYNENENDSSSRNGSVASISDHKDEQLNEQENNEITQNHNSATTPDSSTYPSLSQLHKLSKFKQPDIAKSLLYAISNNIGQIAYLQAERYGLKNIFFAGSFIRNHLQTIITLSYAINFWSKGGKRAYFLRHEGYLGSMGAFLDAEEAK